MRYMMMIKSDEASESGRLPSTEEMAAMGRYNEELVNAGVMLAGEGLQASSHGARITISGGTSTVTDGPFAEAKELVAGFWILQVKSKEEAIEWARRVPGPAEGELHLELRKVFEADDFGDAATAEFREHEERLRERVTEQHA